MNTIFPFQRVRESKGFSLVEILIAIGLLSLVSLAGSQLIINLLNAQKAIAIDGRLQDILNESKMAFKNPANCSANIVNFSSKDLNSSNYSTLKITVSKWALNGHDILTNDGPIPGNTNGSKVSLSIEKFQEISAGEYKAFAIFNFDRGSVPGGNIRVRELPMNVITTSDIITSCSFSSIEMLSQHDLDIIKSEICTSFGGTYNPSNQKCTSSAASKETMCESLGGVYNSSTQKCSLNSTITSQIAAVGKCSAGFVAIGVDSAGKITCAPQGSGSSSSGSSSSSSSSGSTTTIATNCSGGSFSKTSPNGTNNCFYTYPAAAPYQTVTGTATVGSISGTCKPDGTWDYSYICPDKTGTTCDGGSKTWYSQTGKTSCTCSFDQAAEGQSRTGSCNTGSVSGTCTAGGWSYSVSCKDPAVITCPGGTAVIGSASTSSKTCNCAYNTASAGQSVALACTNGGSISGTCNGAGQWVNVVSKCP